MSYSQIGLSEPKAPGQGLSKDIFDTAFQESASGTLAKWNLPLYLLKFGFSWHHTNVGEVIESDGKVQNLYLDEMLSKRHNPNFILDKVRNSLNADGYFAFKLVTAENIKFKIQQQLPPFAVNVYYPFHFFFRRVLPKLKGFRKVCRWLKTPVDISKAEIMGRLIYKGFQIVDAKELLHETIIVARINPLAPNPSLLNPEPSEGVLFKMKRLGKNAEKITFYKFRSMHPYAEYVQEYLHATQGLENSGKFKNDFRVSTGGRIIRKYWIDELPMLYNLMKGDIKLIGVRPISEHYFGLYPENLQKLRKKHKPGLMPPFYADLPQTFEEIVESELTYLRAYEKAPLKTDCIYLVKIFKNILINKARSK